MNKLIILAGPPASGKSTVAELIIKSNPEAAYLALDNLKEFMYDELSFHNLEQKNEIISFSKEVYFKMIELSVNNNSLTIVDYPFGNQQQSFFDELEKKEICKILTIMHKGDLNTFYERRLSRNERRHPGHLLESYNKIHDYKVDNTLELTFEEYKLKSDSENYQTFSSGELITINTNDLLDYDYIKKQLKMT